MEKPHTSFQDRTGEIGNSLYWEPTPVLLKFAIVSLLTGALVSLMALRIFAPNEPLRAGGPGLALLVAATGWIMLWRGKLKATINVLAFGTLATLTVVAVFTGGVRAPVFMIFPVIILLVGWLASQRIALVMTGLTVATTVSLLIAESTGLLPSPQPSVSVLYGIVQVTLSVLSLFLMGSLVNSYKARLEDLAASKIELSHAQSVGNMGSWVYDMANDTMRLSSEACRIFGLPEGTTESLERYLSRIHEQDRSAAGEAWQRGLNDAPFDCEHRIRVGKSIRWVRQKAAHEPGSDGTPLHTHGIVQDITERKRSEALMELEHAVTRSLTEVDTSRKVLQTVMRVICESECWETAGYFRVEDEAGTTKLVVGWRLAGSDAATTEYYKDVMNTVVPPGGLLSQVALTGKPLWFANMREQHTTWYRRIERTDEKATFSFPVLADAKVIGVLAFSSREIREPDEQLLATVRAIGKQVGQFMQRKQAEATLLETKERLEAAASAGIVGVWDWDIVSNRLVWDKVMYQLHGLDEADLGSADEAWTSTIHPEDKAYNDGEIQAALRGEREYAPGFRVVWPDGSIHHIKAKSHTTFDAKGKPLRMVGINYDVTEQKNIEAMLEQGIAARTQELRKARDAAEAASVAKSAFLANMSHEMRTPLHQISGIAQLIRREPLTPKQTDRFEKLEIATHNLTTIIDTILNLTKIEADQFDVVEEPLSPQELVAEVLASVQTKASEKHLHLDSTVSNVPTTLLGDRAHLKQALLNYVANAIRFTEMGTISVRVSRTAELSDQVLVRFEVEDSGPGIDPQDLPRMFSVFEQVDNSSTRKHGGLGMGLAMTKKIAEIMGGEAGCESQLGKGSTFWFTVRLRRA